MILAPRMLQDRPILVLGLPRSGTSIIAGALQACGAWLGHTVPAGRSNPKGFFENVFLREQVNKPILQQLDCDPLGVHKLPVLDSLPTIDWVEEKVRTNLTTEGYPGTIPWVFKDPKLSLIWPIWRHAFPQARWIIVRRDVEDVVRSCLRTHFMVHHSTDPAFWRTFADAYLERLAELQQSEVWYREIWPRDVVAGDRQALRGLVEDLEMSWNERAVRRLVKPRFWHSRA